MENVQVQYRGAGGASKIIRNLDLALEKHQTLGIVGESGSGKTTLIRAVLGLLPPGGVITGGRILFQGQDLLKLSREERRRIRGRRIGMIFQEPGAALNPVRKIGAQFSDALCAHFPMPKQEARQRALDMLAKMLLPDPEKIFTSYSFQLSGGMKQRVTIALALALEPELLLADEPTSALDVTVQAQMIKEMQRLQQELKTSIILVSHNMGVVAQMADRIGVMYGGELVEWGPKERVINHPGHPYTKALLSSIPRLDQKERLLPSISGQPPRFGEMPRGCTFSPRCPEAVSICAPQSPGRFVDGWGHMVCCTKIKKGMGWTSYPTSKEAAGI
ncbi:hypothetical protein DCMF_25160 [Candidatus Formimonas warabiya]|uniref:ABC transporter domain-containing protein n=2 Tax=Formimonas warabiya TaxID=1761012 RepID=A0A3G1L288_FORW1|nr:hypothetical protein DCMF_25160 [Candidatus Formimonas warabiya]